MKKITIMINILVLFIACGKRAPEPGITDTEILIGNIQDLSGPMKELGAVLPAGSNLYFQYINEQGGIHDRKIRMLTEDHQYNPQKAVVAADVIVIPRSFSWSIQSIVAAPSCTSPKL